MFQKKVLTFKLSVTFLKSQRIFKILLYWKAYKNIWHSRKKLDYCLWGKYIDIPPPPIATALKYGRFAHAQ